MFRLLLAVAIIVGITGTAISGRYCTKPDRTGCDDDPALIEAYYSDDRPYYDTDWYGWPVAWRSDLTYADCEKTWCEDGLWPLVDRWGVSGVLLPLSLLTWFSAAVAAEALLLGGRRLWRNRTKQRRGAATAPG